MATTETLDCALSGAELIDRITEWRELASHASRRRVDKGRIVSTYPTDLLSQLRTLIAAEAECCPSMQFSVRERSNEVEVELRVSEEIAEQVAAMLGLVNLERAPAK